MRIILKAINVLVRKSSWYKDVMFGDCQKFWNLNDFGIEVINLGSNSAKFGFDYSNLPINGANWAIGPQPLWLDLSLLQCYYSFLKPGATVIIPLCPFSCLVGRDYSYFADKYYTILHHSLIPAFNIHKRQFMMNIKSKPAYYIPFFELIKEFVRVFKKRDQDICISENDFLRSKQIFVKSWKKQFFISDFDEKLDILNSFNYEESSKILNSIVDFCERYGFNPVIVMPPVSHALNSEFSDKAKKFFIEDYVKKAIRGRALFLNYFDDKELCSNELFRNCFFLNKAGAMSFTKRVLRDINLI